jgi:predicted lipase
MAWKEPKRLPNIWKYLGRASWTATAFDQDKAFVCCVFSEYAYRHVPKFEVDKTRRVKLLPCFDYLRIASRGLPRDVREELRAVDFGATFVVETEDLIALGVETPRVIIIALRGTHTLSDVILDLDADQISLPGLEGALFHSGFYRGIANAADQLSTNLLQLNWKGLPIYVTGHSLGGAMSAILHGLWERLLPRVSKANVHSLGAYTFAMPRYGNTNAVASMVFPYHIYRQRDLVPSLPPRVMNYADSPDEYLCAKHELIPKFRDDYPAALQIFRSMPIPGVILRTHAIEGYRRRIHRIVQESDARSGS